MLDRSSVPSRLGRLTGAELGALAASFAADVRASTPLTGTDRAERGGLHLAVDDVYDVWLLWWPPGTSVSPHDHGDSAGAFTVVSGQLREVRWQRAARRTRLVDAGETVRIGRGVVHDVVGGDTGALSVHVYSPPLTSMGYYDPSGSTLLGRRAVDEPEPDRSMAEHPARLGPRSPSRLDRW